MRHSASMIKMHGIFWLQCIYDGLFCTLKWVTSYWIHLSHLIIPNKLYIWSHSQYKNTIMKWYCTQPNSHHIYWIEINVWLYILRPHCKCKCYLISVIFKSISGTDILSIATSLHRYVGRVMAWCRQATNHYPSICSPRFMTPYDVTRPQRISRIEWNILYFRSFVQQVTLAYDHSAVYTTSNIYKPWHENG